MEMEAREAVFSYLLSSSSGPLWAEEACASGFRLLEKAWRCFTRRRTTSTCSSEGLKGSWGDKRAHGAACTGGQSERSPRPQAASLSPRRQQSIHNLNPEASKRELFKIRVCSF
ncbi:hypothetical protein EYF80_065241 [Liparis tanakae]|uniref:Uncharacterized protein n=1 Tax=Liparis tanakae TaxID=230148 RepID=A0A4Z2E7V8_9TELE|nr:hypothetical protein EYF80_065241 [Liparis tanakae]